MDLKDAVEAVATWRWNGLDAGLRHLEPYVRLAIDELVTHARRSLDAPKAEVAEERNPEVDNLWRATQIVREIDQLRGVVAELKSAFARNELDGGVKAAYTHPLYIQAQARLAELHEQLMMVI